MKDKIICALKANILDTKYILFQGYKEIEGLEYKKQGAEIAVIRMSKLRGFLILWLILSLFYKDRKKFLKDEFFVVGWSDTYKIAEAEYAEIIEFKRKARKEKQLEQIDKLCNG